MINNWEERRCISCRTKIVAVLAMLAVFIPPLTGGNLVTVLLATFCLWLSCTLVSLIILSQGSASGLRAIMGSIAAITVVAWVLIGSPQLGVVIGLMQWAPIILLSQALRTSKSLAMTLLAGVGLGVGAIVMQHLLLGPIDNTALTEALQSMGGVPAAGEAPPELAPAVVETVRLLMLAMVAVGYLFVVLIVICARWMQARLFAQEGAFGEEFRALSLGRAAAAIALAVLGLTIWLQQPWLVSIVLVLVMAFMFQGIAVVHANLGPKRHGRTFLTVFYVLMLISKEALALAAVTGVIDNWLVFRKKKEQPNEENED